MTLKLERRSCIIKLPDEYEGANVKGNLDVSLDTYMIFLGLEGETPQSIDLPALREAIETFGREVLVSWDIEENGVPVPATAEGLRTLPIALVLPMMQGWAEAAAGVPKVSNAPSANGATLAAASIPLGE